MFILSLSSLRQAPAKDKLKERMVSIEKFIAAIANAAPVRKVIFGEEV